MFKDKYGLTQSALEGRKTMTRRVVKLIGIDEDFLMDEEIPIEKRTSEIIDAYAHYQVGEVVAIAQSYRDTWNGGDWIHECYKKQAGWKNKMFVKAELMPHHIRITNIRVERLQDISDEDCLREGIRREKFGDSMHYYFERNKGFYSAKDAFSILIDKVSKKSTWDINPYVFVYEFELVD